MKPTDQLKLVSQLLDLPIVDRDERACGIVDDIELEGGAGKETRIKALLVGPGAYRGRMPRWMFALVGAIAGKRIVRVPVGEIIEIGCTVKLKCTAQKLGLRKAENKAAAWIPRKGAL
jgi:sporulation protein YlmC with PRC-barrel domain